MEENQTIVEALLKMKSQDTSVSPQDSSSVLGAAQDSSSTTVSQDIPQYLSPGSQDVASKPQHSSSLISTLTSQAHDVPLIASQVYDTPLRPYTWGNRFLIFLPDSHSAYYDSFVSALGQSLPPHWVFQGFVVLGPVETAGGEGGVGGGITHHACNTG